MKIIDYQHKENDISNIKDYIDVYYKNILCTNSTYKNHVGTNHYIYFDIETTGLSARNSTLYLIGALWFDKDTIFIRQWFNEDGYSENEIIKSFNDFCISFSHLVHFNGTTFDVPYIRDKAAKHSLSIENIEKLKQLDIYKDIRSYKSLLGLENVKQVTIEKFLGIIREDIYSGGDLINIYQRYVARPDEEREHLLLLHNHDDLLGMPAVSNILRYKILFENPDLTIQNITYDSKETKLIVEIYINDYCSLPKRLIHTNKDGIYINVSDNSATLIIPVINATLKHFFKDYKNYYYLPKEDMAIHKSVAAYVDPDNRQRATKSNCYITKEAAFIPCPDNDFEEAFKNSINDKICYRTLESLLNDNQSNKTGYVKNILKNFR